jgi:hypothetical protein
MSVGKVGSLAAWVSELSRWAADVDGTAGKGWAEELKMGKEQEESLVGEGAQGQMDGN